MADNVSEERRSYLMSRVGAKNTAPEVAVRSMLHRQGFRFTVNGPRNRQLPGRPDIVLPVYRTVIFVHGCFWHGHTDCRDHRIPKSRTEWWREKITANRERDQRAHASLDAKGWRIVVVWTCALGSRRNQDLLGEVLAMALRDGSTTHREIHDRTGAGLHVGDVHLQNPPLDSDFPPQES